MSLDDIVDLSIVVTSATLTRAGFGTPLALVSKVPSGWGTSKVRTFSKLSELTDLGFTSSDPAYKIAQKMKSQNPALKKFKIAKRANVPSQSLQLKCTSATEGDVYSFELGIGGGATTAVTYTVPASATTTTVATAIELLTEAVGGVNSSSSTNIITIVPATADTFVNIKSWSSNIEVTDATADPGVEDDLDACLAADSDWYGLLLDYGGKAQILAAAEWAETNKKLYLSQSSDAACTDSNSSTDVLSALKAAAYTHAPCIFSAQELLDYRDAAWLAKGLTFDPGSITWAFKTLADITVDKLTTGQQEAIEAKNGNYYCARNGKNITWEGKRPDGDYIDVTHGLDWLDAEMRLQVFAAVSSQPKLPYTSGGLAVIEATIKGVLKAAARAGVLVDDDTMTVTMPTLEDIDPVTKATRLLPNIEFRATLQGAIHKTQMIGTVSA